MNHKLALITLIFIIVTTTSARRRTLTAPPDAKPQAVRLMVQGTYEETFQGVTSDGNADGKLVIKFEAARWLSMGTNEVSNAEFSDLANAPVPYVTGSVTYNGQLKGSRDGDNFEATSVFTGALSGEDVKLTVPGYTDTGNNFKMKVFINPKLKGKCSMVAVRGDQKATSSDCANGTYFVSLSSPMQIDDNDDPAKTVDTANIANFGLELDIEPALEPAGAGGQSAGDDSGYAWRGAVTTGSKEAGFKIALTKTKVVPSDDKRSKSIRTLNFSATILPGIPK